MPNWNLRTNANLYTFSGRAAWPEGAPTVQDIAIALSREGRYAGAGIRWWPVVLHTFVVCDLLPNKLKLHGLLHDAPEAITGDIPKPVKIVEMEDLENKILSRIYSTFELVLPTSEEHLLIKEADRLALCGEVYTVGTQALQQIYPRYPEAEDLVMKYLVEFPPLECLTPDGRAPIEFIRRFRRYSEMLKEWLVQQG